MRERNQILETDPITLKEASELERVVETGPLAEKDAMTEVPNAITPEEFAKHFGWSARRVRELARELGACRIVGNRMVLLQQDVDALLEAARPKPRPKPSSHQFNGPAIPQGSYAALVKSREKGKLDTTQAALDYLAARVKKKPK